MSLTQGYQFVLVCRLFDHVRLVCPRGRRLACPLRSPGRFGQGSSPPARGGGLLSPARSIAVASFGARNRAFPVVPVIVNRSGGRNRNGAEPWLRSRSTSSSASRSGRRSTRRSPRRSPSCVAAARPSPRSLGASVLIPRRSGRHCAGFGSDELELSCPRWLRPSRSPVRPRIVDVTSPAPLALQLLDCGPHVVGVPRRPVVALRQPRYAGPASCGNDADRQAFGPVLLADRQELRRQADRRQLARAGRSSRRMRWSALPVAVGMRIAAHPPHRSGRGRSPRVRDRRRQERNPDMPGRSIAAGAGAFSGCIQRTVYVPGSPPRARDSLAVGRVRIATMGFTPPPPPPRARGAPVAVDVVLRLAEGSPPRARRAGCP